MTFLDLGYQLEDKIRRYAFEEEKETIKQERGKKQDKTKTRQKCTNPRSILSSQQIPNFVVVNFAYGHFKRVALIWILTFTNESINKNSQLIDGVFIKFYKLIENSDNLSLQRTVFYNLFRT